MERCLRILATRDPANVIIELLAALVGEIEHQEPRRALEGVALLSRQEHGLARRQREHPPVVCLRMVAKVLESILARRADQIQIARGVELHRFEVTGQSLEEPSGAARQEGAMQRMRELVLEHDVFGSALLGAHHQHRFAEEIHGLVERAHRGARELVQVPRGGELQHAQLLARQRVALP